MVHFFFTSHMPLIFKHMFTWILSFPHLKAGLLCFCFSIPAVPITSLTFIHSTNICRSLYVSNINTGDMVVNLKDKFLVMEFII